MSACIGTFSLNLAERARAAGHGPAVPAVRGAVPEGEPGLHAPRQAPHPRQDRLHARHQGQRREGQGGGGAYCFGSSAV